MFDFTNNVGVAIVLPTKKAIWSSYIMVSRQIKNNWHCCINPIKVKLE